MMKTFAALLGAAYLCAPVAAKAQSAPATVPTATPSPAAKPLGKPALIAGAPGANLQALSGDSEGCPRGPNGEEECTVEVSGSSNRGGSGGGGLGGGGGGIGGPQSCGSSKVLQAVPCTPDTSGGTGPSDEEKLAKIRLCNEQADNRKVEVEKAYNNNKQICARDNPDPSGSISIGATVSGTGGSISLPAEWFSSAAEKRKKCETDLKNDRDTEMKLIDARANSCRVKAANGY